MSVQRFSFDPVTGLSDQSVFPATPQSEEDAREQFMRLFNQLKDYVNGLAELIETIM